MTTPAESDKPDVADIQHTAEPPKPVTTPGNITEEPASGKA